MPWWAWLLGALGFGWLFLVAIILVNKARRDVAKRQGTFCGERKAT